MIKTHLNAIISQLKYDLIGKDSHRGVTLTYSWLANQFGHFSLGFIPTYLLYLGLKNYYPIEDSAIYATISIAIVWTFFEIYNFIAPLIKLRKVSAFKPDYKNIGFDTFTDLCFFYIGGLVAFLSFSTNKIVWVLFIILILALIPFSYYWYITKFIIQTAQFPFQSRLSQFTFPVENNNKKMVLDFINSKDFNNLLICGEKLSGKTSLAVSISTELSIKRTPCFYTTEFKLLEMLNLSDSELLQNTSNIITWRTSSCLIIDDISSGNNFFERLKNNDFKNQNIATIKNQKNIWVIGGSKKRDQLVNALLDLGIEKTNVLIVNLESSKNN